MQYYGIFGNVLMLKMRGGPTEVFATAWILRGGLSLDGWLGCWVSFTVLENAGLDTYGTVDSLVAHNQY